MAKRIKINVYGRNGRLTLEVPTRDGSLPERIQVPNAAAASVFAQGTPETVEAKPAPIPAQPIHPRPDTKPRSKPGPVVDPAAVMGVLQRMTRDADPQAADPGWFILDEVLFVATARCGIQANHLTLLNAFRHLYRHGQVQHKTNRFEQHTFRLVPQPPTVDAPALLADVDATLGKGDTPDAEKL